MDTSVCKSADSNAATNSLITIEVEVLTNDNCLQEEKAAAATPAERTHGVVWYQPVWNALVRQVVQETRTKAVSARSQRDPVRTCSVEPTPPAR